jgi:hypothetical protein
MSDQAPPQWAEDPSGRHRYRYWDGTRWTAHIYDGPAPPQGPPQAHDAVTTPITPPEPTVVAPHERAVVEPEEHGYVAEAEATDFTDDEPHGRRGGGGRGRGGDPIRAAFLKGAAAGGGVVALLAILATVVLGGGDGGDVSTTSTTKDKSTTTSTAVVTTLPTPTTLPPGRPPSEVRVIVLNGSGVGGAASTKEAELKKLGYNVTSIGNADVRDGSTVGCRPGFENEAAALAAAAGTGVTVAAFPNPEPANSSNADCVLTMGK